MRANRIEAALQAADAGAILLNAITDERIITGRFKSVVLVALDRIFADIDELAAVKSQGRRANLVQTYTFAVKNLADAVKAIGITGLAKRVQDGTNGGDDRYGDGWKTGAMAQLNVLIQNAPGGSVSVSKAEKPVETDQTVKNVNA